mgnify:CR=1 FL=1
MKTPKRKKWKAVRWFHFSKNKPSCCGHYDYNDAKVISCDMNPDLRRILMTEVG